MAITTQALEFLYGLERDEARALTWGLVNGFFSEAELEERANEFLTRVNQPDTPSPYDSGWEIIEALLDETLLWRIPETDRYRTRMAETVRLFSRLRQIFPDARNVAWRTAPNLVADYRLLVNRRLYPSREVSTTALLEGLRRQTSLSPLQERIIASLTRAGTQEERRLSHFQARAAYRILAMFGQDRSFGTVVSAGTGSGKTLAFYLPAYAAMASQVSGEYWTKCLALYPRNELLKDQLREALSNARRIAPALEANGKRKLVIAALYGDVPHSATNLLSESGLWTQLTINGRQAYECPFVRCPRCLERMAWMRSDIDRNIERLCCTDTSCGEHIEADEIRLTRQRMLAEPPDVLFTSTEMLNQRLSSARFAHLFGIGLRPNRRPGFVLVDEVHSYEGIHGAHVALLLRRWRRAAEAHPHFVGLSATLADAPRFFAELVGIGPGDVSEVRPELDEMRGEGAEYMLALRGDPSSGASLLSTSIQALMLLRRVLAVGRNEEFGRRVFAFTDNLDVINRLFHNLLDAEGWDASGRPNPARVLGSLANLRSTTLPSARERLDAGQNWALVEDIGHVLATGSRVRVSRTSSQDVGVDANAAIVVATSALEVGFDDPDVGAMLQHKAPQSPAAFLQRKGRAGRRQNMRPWTVVVLSDYGRDRAAYLGYDQLFSPHLPARYLPLRNRAVLRMQATFVLFDWLARRLPSGVSPDPWIDFSQPASEISNPRSSNDVAHRQSLYIPHLRAVLEQDVVRDEFARFLGRSLALDDEEVTAILWEPPRSLMTEAVPTLLRRLERGWRRANGEMLEHHVPRAPLPEFVPRMLFTDLQLPEVSVRIPAQGRTPARIEGMPIAQALREFAPGRVSRRFGVTHGRERYWVAPGNSDQIAIDAFCPPSDRLEVGRFRYVQSDGSELEVPVFRPYAIDVSQTPLNIQQSSNSFLQWATEIAPTAAGHDLDIPSGSRWQEVLCSLSIHSHHLGLPVETRRFAVGANASIGRGQGQPVAQSLRFVCTSADGVAEPAAIGFVADVDALQVTFVYPSNLHELCMSDERLVRGLRAARFKELVRATPLLQGLANDFQRDWLSQVYLSAVTAEALREQLSLQEAEAAIHSHSATTTVREVLETILQWSDFEPDDDDPPQPNTGEPPRRLQELIALLNQYQTAAALHEAARVLWERIGPEWESWLQARFKSTLGAALVEAAYSLCPRMDPGALVLDLRARVERSDRPENSVPSNQDEIWITESTIGGGGFVEDFLRQYVSDPRRYFRLLETALAPSDLESVSDELGRLLQFVTSDTEGHRSLVDVFAAVRDAASHSQSMVALNALRSELARSGVQPTATLVVSVNARILGPGTTPDSDRFLASSIEEWQDSERRLGIDIDTRVFSLVKSTDTRLDQALGLTLQDDGDDATAAWRYGVLYGMFWPRGAQIRAEALRGWNPFERLPDCDRLLVLATLSQSTRSIALSNPDWFGDLAGILVKDGLAELVANVDDSGLLASALLRIGMQPVDSEALLIHARIAGVRREGSSIIAEIELPEAFQ
jgi:hypothetical protein